MTLIAITQRTEHSIQNRETRDVLDQQWGSFLDLCDITPLIIPNNIELANKLIQKIPPDGLLFSGGNGSLERYETEKSLMETAINKKLPILGVCHGMQFIQQYFGLKLQKISNHVSDNLRIMINGKIEEVNSYHDYGTIHTLPELIVWAKADDGIIKAIRHIQLPISGIMWHPERCIPFKYRDIEFIKKVFSMELF